MHVDKIIQLKADEEILEVVHEDIVPHVPKFFFLFLWIVIPFFFLFPLFRLGWIGVVIFFALLGAALFVGMRSYVKWAHTVLVVTDRRVVDLEQRGLFDRVVTEAPYPHIDEVSYRVKGIVPTMFRYGDLHVKMSGSAADLVFRRVKGPSRVHDLINDLCAATDGEVRDLREKKLREMARTLSSEEVDELVGQVRKRDRDQAIEEVFSDDEAA